MAASSRDARSASTDDATTSAWRWARAASASAAGAEAECAECSECAAFVAFANVSAATRAAAAATRAASASSRIAGRDRVPGKVSASSSEASPRGASSASTRSGASARADRAIGARVAADVTVDDLDATAVFVMVGDVFADLVEELERRAEPSARVPDATRLVDDPDDGRFDDRGIARDTTRAAANGRAARRARGCVARVGRQPADATRTSSDVPGEKIRRYLGRS